MLNTQLWKFTSKILMKILIPESNIKRLFKYNFFKNQNFKYEKIVNLIFSKLNLSKYHQI